MLKTLTFAALHFSTAFSVTYVLTGSIGVSGTVALVEPLINTVVFYSGLNLNQYGVASPCRTICTVCGFVALS
ncbi:DUF2061 domain-containing protein [Neisseria meningitidis]|uniref:DUF2061 domain-containing protein n=1 Tax=Neisseria meningitidis TaxID=487 RepID=UPI000814CD2B|nr:DUF2061 domain-containing protein [Neisseria meningitidis]ANX37492.1 hypothetical protein A6L48_00835 [Neisseria meningitidis]